MNEYVVNIPISFDIMVQLEHAIEEMEIDVSSTRNTMAAKDLRAFYNKLEGAFRLEFTKNELISENNQSFRQS